MFTLRENRKDSLGLAAPGRHRTTFLPQDVQKKHACGTGRQSVCVWGGHSQQGEPQLGKGVVDIADGGDGGDGQGAGRQGQVGGAREVSTGGRKKKT